MDIGIIVRLDNWEGVELVSGWVVACNLVWRVHIYSLLVFMNEKFNFFN